MATMAPTAPQGDDGSNAEGKFHILWDVTISWTLKEGCQLERIIYE